MPDFTFRGASGGSAPGSYPMLRDSYGVLAGTVTPGDVLEFPEAPDGDWAPYEAGDAERAMHAAELVQAAATLTGGDRDSDDQAGEPAAIPDASDDTAGTGQEEADQ